MQRELITRDFSQEFLRLVMANPVNAALLDRLPALDLPDWYLAAGCLFQSVWNGLTGKPSTYGISDYDVIYCDRSDLSWAAEDAVIKVCSQAFADIEAKVQVRNQARIHLWYPQKHGIPCAPLCSSREGIDQFLNQSSCFGVRRDRDGRLDVYAPFGFQDLFAMVIRPNSQRDLPGVYHEKATRWCQYWPGLTIVPWPATD